jgi:predicted neuraminidase
MQYVLEQKIALFPDIGGECHASTLVALPHGNFAAAWFQGTKEGKNDVAIYGSRCLDGVWSTPEVWAKVNDLPHWNPVLFQVNEQTLLLFFKVGTLCERWQTWVQSSNDNGKTWSAARELVAGAANARGPAKNKPIRLADGSILAGNSLEDNAKWRVLLDKSTDECQTWHSSPEILQNHAPDDLGVIQPTIWESAPGKVHILTRSSSHFIYRSDSDDFGTTWSPLYKTTLPSNNSGIDAAYSDGTLILAFNNTSGDWKVRTPLTLAKSTDNGATWQILCDLENDAGEFSYPAIIPLGNGHFAGTYTNRRHTITFFTLEI